MNPTAISYILNSAWVCIPTNPPMKNRLKRLLKVKKDHIFHEMWAIWKLVINAWLLLHPLFNGKFEKIITCVEILDLGKKGFFDGIYIHEIK